MSILTVLCFTSLLYFSLADPIPSGAAPPPLTDAQIAAVVDDIQKLVQARLAPQLQTMDKADQDYLMKITNEGILDYINFVETLIRRREKEIKEHSEFFADTDSPEDME